MTINRVTGSPGTTTQRSGGSGQTGSLRGDASSRGQSAEQAAATDTVSITDSAARLRGLEARLADLPVVDNQRVEAVRQQLADGSYQVDAEQVADKLIAMESALLSK